MLECPKYVYERTRVLPSFVRTLCFSFDGWIVGNSAKYMAGKLDTINNWDVIIPVYRWMDIHPIIPYKTESNTFGGFKVKIENTFVDVWPEDLGHHFNTVHVGYDLIAANPKYQQIAVCSR